MKLIIIIVSIALMAYSCSGPDVRLIADELCACKKLPATEGEKCFLNWEEKYADIRLTESQKATFDGIVMECMQ
jgi:hypothetical protein